MPEWVVCPTCNLKHQARADRLCPRCREAIDRSSGFAPPPPAPSTGPSAADARPGAAAPPPIPAAASPAPAGAARCESCGAIGPVGRVEFHQNIGALIVRFHKSVKGNVCPACAKKHFQELTLITLVGGWWGVISFFMTPFILVNNVLQYLSYKPGGPIGMPVPPAAAPGFAPSTSTAGPVATGQRKGLAIASLVLGLIGLLTFGLFGVGAMIGLVLGGIAIWKATKQPAEYGGRGIAIGGVIVNAANGAMAVVLVVLIVAGQSTPHPPPAPGETAFQVASSRIFMFHGETAFGNTPDAKALAERHSRIMASLSEVMFTGGPSKGRPSLSDDKFLTYCERRPGRICFLVHVPALRSYQGEARSALLKIAWTAAREVTKEARTPADLRLAVGLRGAVAYGATAMGMGEGTPVNAIAEILDEKPLYEFFLDAGGAATEPAAVGGR